jgi:16S rRNA G1207 methylase RsmC
MPRKNEEVNHYFSKRPRSEPKLGVIRTYLRGMPFEFMTASGVFSKERVDPGTRLLVESMVLPKSGSVLDVGCGYGVVGIAAAVFNPSLRVVLVDVNERAVWLAKQNVRLNRAENVEVRSGHLYQPVKGLLFNCVLSNPPVSAGIKTVKEIIVNAPEHMASKALFQMVVRSKIAGERLQTFFREAFGKVEVLARKSGYRVLAAEKSS